jgi:hypothetical protein
MFSNERRVCSTIIEAILIALPSTVESNWNSIAHKTFGRRLRSSGSRTPLACVDRAYGITVMRFCSKTRDASLSGEAHARVSIASTGASMWLQCDPAAPV